MLVSTKVGERGGRRSHIGRVGAIRECHSRHTFGDFTHFCHSGAVILFSQSSSIVHFPLHVSTAYARARARFSRQKDGPLWDLISLPGPRSLPRERTGVDWAPPLSERRPLLRYVPAPERRLPNVDDNLMRPTRIRGHCAGALAQDALLTLAH